MNGSYYKNSMFPMDSMYERDTEAPGGLNEKKLQFI